MKYQRMGTSGLKLSRFSLGSWVTYGKQVDQALARACILAAYERGVNFFDNAEAYADGKAEEVVGKVLGELRRESFVVSSKVFWGGSGPNDRGLSRKHVIEACNAALRRIQVDYLDLYYCHRPDPHTPLEETVHAMDLLIRQGKILYWGTSEWSADQVRAAWDLATARGWCPPSVEQPEYHMFHRERVERELLPLYEEIGLGTTTWSPLASGLLTGKYDEGIPDGSRFTLPGMGWLQESRTPDRVRRVKALAPIAADLGCSRAQLALAWCARFHGVSSVITGASRPEQVVENLGAEAIVDKLDAAVTARIEAVLDGVSE